MRLAAKEETVFPLAAAPSLAENSHPAFQLSTAILHPGLSFAILNTATEFDAALYDFCGGPRSSGYFRDAETGNDYAVNRYHQPGMGRFLTPDPYMASAGPSNPGSWNRYAYGGGDPIKYKDPGGRYVCDPDSDSCGDDGSCGANWMTDASQSGPCDGSGGGGDSDPSNVCGGNSFFNSETGSCEDDSNGEDDEPDCTIQMYTRMLSGLKGSLLGFLGTHSYLVVTETGAPMVTFDGRHNGNLLQGAYATPGSSTSDPTNNPNNTGRGYAFSTVADGPPAQIPCSDIGSMEQAVTNFNSGPPVTYHTFGPNSNSFLNWLLNQVGLGGLYGQPPGGWGWNTPIPGH